MARSKAPIISADGVCAPVAQGNAKLYGTCMPPKYMREIAKLYNECTTSNPIPREVLASPNALKQELDKRFQCSDDKCWLQNSIVQQKYDLYKRLERLYRPTMPRSWKANPREWLSDLDIRNVMKQYEDQFRNFKFMGVFPIDFKENGVCSMYSVCNFNLFDFLNETKGGKRDLGVVLNLDKHTGSGSHWVAAFASFNPKSSKFGLCYYDSSGKKPPEHARQFLKELKTDAALYFKDSVPDFEKRFTTKYNNKKHQAKNTECGVFSMLFLITCLEHKNATYNDVCGLMGENWDDEAHKYRKSLFYATNA